MISEFFFFQAEDGIRDFHVTGVQTCALPIWRPTASRSREPRVRGMTAVLGWDVGGVNTKVARVVQGTVAAAHAQPYEIQRDPTALGSLLARLAAEQGAATGAAHAVTMTAELSQMFRTKREGVRFVLDAVTDAFPQADVRVYATDGRFLSVAAARVEPLAVAAANWAATAHLVAQSFSEAILIDTGTTTTDIIPIAGGRVAARGRTDHERLREGELVYTGALRTPAEAIAHTVVLHGAPIGVSAEGFALAGDVHLWLGNLAPEDYTVPTPDGRPATRQFAGERLARVICADRELLDEAAIDAIGEAARGRRLVIVPGGGPFADAVRQMFNRFGIGEEAAHWMAILGMDQYAHALVARISGAALVEGETEIAATLAAGRIPVLAPFRWLRTADPLPHSWDVTSDSIAAWLTGALGARRLVLIKPASRQPASQLVDAHFVRALPAGVAHLILTDDDLAQPELTLREGGPEGRAPARQG